MHISKDNKIELDESLNLIENGWPKYEVKKYIDGDRVTYQLVGELWKKTVLFFKIKQFYFLSMHLVMILRWLLTDISKKNWIIFCFSEKKILYFCFPE